jgi:uncharacterized protein with PIN domain
MGRARAEPPGDPCGQVSVRFYQELNDFLPWEVRKRSFSASFRQGDTVKALCESLGVPHTEVDLVLVNGTSVGFDYQLRQADRLSVYPVFESLEIGGVTRVRPASLRRTRFLLDVHLGRLARLLRMLGFDSHYDNSLEDAALCRLAREQGRIILTRDRELLKRKEVTHAYWVRSHDPTRQLVEVLRRFDLQRAARPFSRCLRCNLPLRRISPEEARPAVPEYVGRSYRSFSRCPGCGRIYWRGSHWKHMKRFLSAELDRPGPS